MAGEIRLQATTGLTVSALIINEAGLVWDGSSLVAVNSIDSATWSAGMVGCTEKETTDTDGTGLYLADWPGGLTQAAIYSVVFFEGNSPAPGTLHIGIQQNPTEYSALDDVIPELGVATPTATPTVRTGLMLLYMALRNKLIVQTSATDAIEIHNSSGVKIAYKTIGDDGQDYTEDVIQ